MNALPDRTTFMAVTPAMRARLEATIEHLMRLLDAIDGDPDLEDGGDDEPSLGWTYCKEWPVLTGASDGDDRELEVEHDEDGGDDEPSGDDEPDVDDELSGDEDDDSWTERWGQAEIVRLGGTDLNALLESLGKAG